MSVWFGVPFLVDPELALKPVSPRELPSTQLRQFSKVHREGGFVLKILQFPFLIDRIV